MVVVTAMIIALAAFGVGVGVGVAIPQAAALPAPAVEPERAPSASPGVTPAAPAPPWALPRQSPPGANGSAGQDIEQERQTRIGHQAFQRSSETAQLTVLR